MIYLFDKVKIFYQFEKRSNQSNDLNSNMVTLSDTFVFSQILQNFIRTSMSQFSTPWILVPIYLKIWRESDCKRVSFVSADSLSLTSPFWYSLECYIYIYIFTVYFQSNFQLLKLFVTEFLKLGIIIVEINIYY